MNKLKIATERLIRFLEGKDINGHEENNHWHCPVEDESADDGNGHIDRWVSEDFQRLINDVKKEL